MSTIGSMGYAAQIASSTSRTHTGDADRVRTTESGERSRFEAAKHGPDATDDVAKADLSADRDPDGRRAWEPPVDAGGESESGEDSSANAEDPRPPRITDTLDAIGGHLDLEA